MSLGASLGFSNTVAFSPQFFYFLICSFLLFFVPLIHELGARNSQGGARALITLPSGVWTWDLTLPYIKRKEKARISLSLKRLQE